MIRCRVCQRLFKWVTVGHLATHKLTKATYLKKFPDAPLMSKAFRKKRSEDRRKDWERDPSRHKRASKQAARQWADPEFRKHLSVITAETWKNPKVRKSRAKGIARSLCALWKDPSYRAIMKRAFIRRSADPEWRRKAIAQLKKQWDDEKRRNAQRDAFTLLRKDPAFCKANVEACRAKRQNDPDYVRRMTRINSEKMKKIWQDPIRAKALVRAIVQGNAEHWKDPSFRERRLRELYAGRKMKWTRPEKTVRRWLKEMNLYQTGTRTQVGFLPHRWLPIRDGFSANADFVDYNHKLIIHVDGVYWHTRPGIAQHDRLVDAWCRDHGWSFVRLTDTQISSKPVFCQKQIYRLVA